MLKRLTHAAIAFVAVVVVYQLYVLAAVPFLEPDWPGRAVIDQSSPERREAAREVVHKYRQVLSAYFPANHWSLRRPPKIFESGRAMVVLDDYHPRDNGRVLVDRCAILFFPQARVRGVAPPRNAIVLESPHGAELQMDSSLRQGPVSIGEWQWAKLLGDIIIRSDMREPGPQDDLRITTRDLYMTEHFIRTDAAVDMRIGPHRGHGREMEINLLPADSAGGGGGLSIGGIESLEIFHEVVAEIQPGGVGLFGETRPGPSFPEGVSESGSEGRQQPAVALVRVTSRGPFRFDFTSFTASFTDQVQAEQDHADGRRDTMQGDELNLYFALDHEAIARGEKRAGMLPLSGMRPASVELKGSPAIVDAPSQGANAECDRMWLEIGPRRVTFESQDEVSLGYRGSEVHAPMVLYQHPPEGSTARIGTMLASGGGWLRAVANPKKPQESFEVRWTESMRLGRRDGQPVLSVEGRPRLDMVGLGRLWADSLELYLREQAAGSDDLPADVVPDRMLAKGRVAIESAELTGRVHQMAVWIDYASDDLMLGQPDGDNRAALRSRLGTRGTGQSRSYGIAGNMLRLQLTVRDRRPEVTSVSVDGSVVFQEMPAEGDPVEPLRIEAAQLRIDKADTPSAEIDIVGAPAVAGHSAIDAQVSVRGMTIRAAAMKLNRGSSRVRINSPGQLEMLVDRDLQGQPLAQSQPLKITWQKSMELDRDRITFLQNVVARGSGGWLQTERLVARLTAPVRFDGAVRQRQPELAQLECWEGMRANFTQQDAGGTTAEHRLQMESFTANLQTGQLQGKGQGWIESVHLASGSGMFGPQAHSPRDSTEPPQRLRFLRVDFQRGVSGNLHQRVVEVFGRVEAIYGPVDSWQQQLRRSLSQGPGEQTIWISCDRLGVRESPMARTQKTERVGALELEATGHVVIEGQDPTRGAFTANANRATYDQQKTMFVLEGDGRKPATLTHQQFVGSTPSESSARKITYWQSTGEVTIEGVNKLQWSQFNVGRGKTRGARREQEKLNPK